MKTKEELDILARQVTNAASCHVDITQDDNGCLTFKCYDDGDLQATILVSPHGETLSGFELWIFEVDGYENTPVGTLDAKMIAGLLSY